MRQSVAGTGAIWWLALATAQASNLEQTLACSDQGFTAAPLEIRRERLAQSGARCEPVRRQGDQQSARCLPPDGAQLYGEAVREIVLYARPDRQWHVTELEMIGDELRQKLEAELQLPMQPNGGPGASAELADGIDDRYAWEVIDALDTPARLACRFAGAAETPPPGIDRATPAESGRAAVMGSLRYPGEWVPPMRVCAIAAAADAARCIDTATGQTDYRIDELAPGSYRLLAWLDEGEARVGGHAESMRCLRAPCPPDRLLPVALSAGQVQADVDLTAYHATLPAGWPLPPPGEDDAILAELLRCRDHALLRATPEAQLERMRSIAALSCEIEQQGGPYVTCAAKRPLQAFGRPVLGLTMMRGDGDVGLDVDVEAPAATLRDAVAAALDLPLAPASGPVDYDYRAPDGVRHTIVALTDTRSSYGCTLTR